MYLRLDEIQQGRFEIFYRLHHNIRTYIAINFSNAFRVSCVNLKLTTVYDMCWDNMQIYIWYLGSYSYLYTYIRIYIATYDVKKFNTFLSVWLCKYFCVRQLPYVATYIALTYIYIRGNHLVQYQNII